MEKDEMTDALSPDDMQLATLFCHLSMNQQFAPSQLSTIFELIVQSQALNNPVGGRTFVKERERAQVTDLFDKLGPVYTRRAYRMEEDNFWRLLAILNPYLKEKDPRAPNGTIQSSLMLSASLRYFAGGAMQACFLLLLE